VQNVVKHSRALVASVSFAVRDRVARLEIADNGIGFDTTRAAGAPDPGLELPSSGYGMLSMAERADLVGGTLEVRSQPGAGTTVTVTVPLDQ
jgi:signal transduction histidine kinase